MEILEKLYLTNVQEVFEGSIKMAKLYEIPSDEILDSKEKIDKYIMDWFFYIICKMCRRFCYYNEVTNKFFKTTWFIKKVMLNYKHRIKYKINL